MREPLEDLATQLFTREMRDEFSIVRAKSEVSDLIRFRVDPGPAFERYGYIGQRTFGPASLDLFQRYRPDDLEDLVHIPLTGCIADDLRAAVGDMDWGEPRPHWREAYRPRDPWGQRMLLTPGSDVSRPLRAVTEAARTGGTACFLWYEPDRICWGNEAMGASVVLSVNPAGEWAMHVGRETRLLTQEPDLSGIVPARGTAPHLAALDLGGGAGTAIRSEDQEPAPSARPAPGRPASRRGPS